MRGEELRDTGRRTGEDVEGPKWEGIPRAGSILEVCGEQSGVWDEISAKAYLLARGQIPWWG